MKSKQKNSFQIEQEINYPEDLGTSLENFFFQLTKKHILLSFQKFRECENKKNSRINYKEFSMAFLNKLKNSVIKLINASIFISKSNK